MVTRGAKPFQFHVKRIISTYSYWENCISTYLTSMKYPMNHRSLTSKSLMPATPSAMNEDVVQNVSNYSWNHHSHDPFKIPWLFLDFSQSSRMDFMLRLPNCTDKHQMLIILTNPTSDIWILRMSKQTCWRDFGTTAFHNIFNFSWPITKFPDNSLTFAWYGISLTFP